MNFLERCGKTGFFRSGPQPLILNEEQRNSRRTHRAEQFKKNRLLSSRANCVIPYLAHNGNYAPIQDDATGENCFYFGIHSKYIDTNVFCFSILYQYVLCPPTLTVNTYIAMY